MHKQKKKMPHTHQTSEARHCAGFAVFGETNMRFIVKFGKQVIENFDFPDNRTARAWADACYPDRPACSVVGVPA